MISNKRAVVFILSAIFITGCTTQTVLRQSAELTSIEQLPDGDLSGLVDFESDIAMLSNAEIIENCLTSTLSKNDSPAFGITSYQVFLEQTYCTNHLLARTDLTLQQQARALTTANRLTDLAFRLSQTSSSNGSNAVEFKIDNPTPYEHVILVSSLQTNDARLVIQQTGELGAAVVLFQSNDLSEQHKHYPLEGLYHAGNLHIRDIEYNAVDQKWTVVLALSDGIRSPLTIDQQQYSPKHSPNAAYLMLIDNATIDDIAFTGLINPADAYERLGVFAIDKVDPTRTPVLMIHGLNSNPLIWRYLTDELLTNPLLNQRYQVLHAFYPSGTPPFYNAMRLRKSLDHFMNSFGLASDGELVLVGHSMGGIISNTFSVDSQYALWDTTFTKRPDVIDKSLDADIKSVFIFQPLFESNTVFFIDTPHQGSDTAQSLIGKIGASIVSLPQDVLSRFKQFIDGIGGEYLTQAMQPFLNNKTPNSVEVLRPNHPLMMALRDLPIQGQAFSIIGSTSALDCELQDCSGVNDGIVDFNSALHPQHSFSVLVPSRHDSYQHPETIRFISEILEAKQ